MRPTRSKSTGQRLFGSLLILLGALGAILLFEWLGQRPPGKSRIDWPQPAAPVRP